MTLSDICLSLAADVHHIWNPTFSDICLSLAAHLHHIWNPAPRQAGVHSPSSPRPCSHHVRGPNNTLLERLQKCEIQRGCVTLLDSCDAAHHHDVPHDVQNGC